MLYIFDGFVLQGLISAYTSLRWVRRFNEVGSFELVLPFEKEKLEILKKDRIVYKRDTSEAAFILDRNIFTDASGNEKLIIKGKMISELMSRRIASYIATASPIVALENIARQNLISATNSARNIPDLILDVAKFTMEPEPIKAENIEVLQIAIELCAGENLGFRIKFDHRNKKYRVQFYQGRDCSNVTFSKQFGNVLDQEYYEESSMSKNTALIDDNGRLTVVGDSNVGLARRESYATFNSSEGGSAEFQGAIYLKQFTPIESMDTVIDTTSAQFEYLKDWDLGDIVSCKNSDWGVVIQKNILEVEEFYDSAGKHLTVIFGDYIPSIKGR